MEEPLNLVVAHDEEVVIVEESTVSPQKPQPPEPPKVTMLNFFTKLPSKTDIKEEVKTRSVAPPPNSKHVAEFLSRQHLFDQILHGQATTATCNDYLTQLKQKCLKPHKFESKLRGPLRAKLLQFSEDVRPPYFGTCQKRSHNITGRSPFGQDTELLDYEVDSEAEWDIGGPGESLKGDDSEDDEELDEYEVDMKFFVPHGYVSDDEVDQSDDEKDKSTDGTINQIEVIDVDAPKQTPKMDIKPIVLGLSFEDCPTISESKVQFLKSFEGLAVVDVSQNTTDQEQPQEQSPPPEPEAQTIVEPQEQPPKKKMGLTSMLVAR